jgi:O-antigen ligase
MISTLSSIPRWAIYALIILTPLPKASVQPWAITSIHMVTLIALTAFLLERTLTWNWTWIKTPLDKPTLALLILSVLSSVFSIHWRTSLWSFILLLNLVVIFYLVIHTVHTRSQVRQLVYIIIGVATFLSVFGILKRFGINPFPWWEYPELPHGNRLTATFGNPNHIAGYLEMALPVIIGLLLTGVAAGKRVLVLCLIFITLMALVLTLSRGAWFGALVGLFCMAMCLVRDRHFVHKRVILGLVAGLVAVGLIVLSSTTVVERISTVTQEGVEPNLGARVVVWGRTVDIIRDYPVLGTGPGTFSTIFTQYQPPGFSTVFTMAHNDYLQFISETGLPLIGVMAWMLIGLYKKASKKLENPSRLVRGITIGAGGGITAVLAHSFVDFDLHIPASVILLVILVGLVVNSSRHGTYHPGSSSS